MLRMPGYRLLAQIPSIQESAVEEPVRERVVYVYFHLLGRAWWVTGYDGDETFYGFVEEDNIEDSGWRTFTLSELRATDQIAHLVNASSRRFIRTAVVEVKRDMRWKPTAFAKS